MTPSPDSSLVDPETLHVSERVLLALRRIMRRTDLHSRKLLQEFGLTAPQLIVLREVAERGELSGSALAEAVSVSLPTATGIVSRLEKQSLLSRRRSTSDRRQVLVSITEAGRETLAAAPAPLQETFTAQLARLPEWEQTQILSVLQRVVAMMEAEELDASPMLATGHIDPTAPTNSLEEADPEASPSPERSRPATPPEPA